MFGMHLQSGMQKVVQTVSAAVHVRICLGVYSGPESFLAVESGVLWHSLASRERIFGSNPLLQAVQRRDRSWVRTEEGRENALEKERKLQLYRLKKLGVKCSTNVPQTIWWRAEYRGDGTLHDMNSMTWLMAGLGILQRLHPLCCTLALCEWVQMAEGCAGLQRAMITVISWEWEPRRATMDQHYRPVKSVPCQAGKGHDAQEKGSEYQLFLWCAEF